MNIENLLKEIDSEKEKLASEVELYDTELLSDYYRKDLMFLFPLLFVATGLVLNATGIGESTKGIGYTLTTLACMLLPTLPPVFSLFQRKNLSFSYYLKSAFKKEKLIKEVLSEKKKVVSNKQIDNEFLKKIALNMDKVEFKKFLKECDGNITIRKIEELIKIKNKEKIKLDNIENLAEIIFEENESLSLESKRNLI